MVGLNGNKMSFVIIGIVVFMVIGGGSAKADFVIGDAVLMDETINHPSSRGIEGGSLSHDGLRFYFSMERDGGYGGRDIWVCERESAHAPWGDAMNLGPNINGPASENEPEISHDELELYFRSGGGGWRSTRGSNNEPWGPPTVYNGFHPEDFSSDGLTMYFTDRLSLPGYGEGDIWMVTRASTDGDWGNPINLGPNVNNERRQGNACISHDDLALFFNEDDSLLMKMSVRRSRDSDWGPAVDISATLCPDHLKRYNPELSPDGRTLYFHHHDWGAFAQRKYWQAPIIPIVDLNADGIVDAADLCIIVDNWGTDNSLCDIGPMPWGDGTVDVQDLIVLAEHLFEEDPVKPFMGDDFESYTDTPGNIIWDTWMDFYKNNTGARIGYGEPPHAEVQIVHGGNQAMPFFYDNDGTVLEGTVFEKKGTEFYAEVQRQWAIPQDWTSRGVEVLTLWFYGEPDNSADPFYVVLEDHAGNRKEVQHPNPAAVTLERWEQWSIPIADFTGVDPTTIKIMGIGVGDPTSSQPGGSGLLRIDDIELHRSSGQ